MCLQVVRKTPPHLKYLYTDGQDDTLLLPLFRLAGVRDGAVCHPHHAPATFDEEEDVQLHL